MPRQFAQGTSAYPSYSLRGNEIYTVVEPQAGGSGGSGSEGRKRPYNAGHGCKYFPADRLLPVALQLRLGAAIKGGASAAGEPLCRATQLLHAEDADFAGCWFSPAFDLGNDNPAFWMLRKTATDTWQLNLRRGKAVVASYRAKIKGKHAAPINLKLVRTNNKFKQWPATVTISE
jgi:hypothetical protein